MCGIAGIYNLDHSTPVEVKELYSVLAAVKHRGPDDEGIYLNNYIGLAHKRLSIIDLEGGHQPMKSKDENLIIIFNGEIYNYIELKKNLKDLGHQFTSNSDTEVILNAYAEWGEKCVLKFNGMWAFTILDLRHTSPKLFCSRDRLGIKPFYYTFDKKRFQFASELKAFDKFNGFTPRINKLMVWDAMVFGPKASGDTLIEGVTELGPGENLIVSEKGVIRDSYFDLYTTFESQRIDYDGNEIESLLIDAVQLRLRSDVPVATINSGGLDSSLLSSISSKEIHDLRTYSVAPELDSRGKIQAGDERKYAEIIARYLSTNHNTVQYSLSKFHENLSDTIYYNDGFLFHSNSVPLNILFDKIKSDGVTVVLGGEGADEIFRGYYSNQLLNMRKMTGDLISRFLIERKYRNRKYLFSFDQDILRIIPYIRNSTFSPERADSLLNITGEMCDERQEEISKMMSLDPSNGLAFFEQTSYLSGLLKRADRMSMMHSVELRVPYLDHRLVTYLNGITHETKCGTVVYREKRILKQIGRKYLPSSIVRRKKYGFASPINALHGLLMKQKNWLNISPGSLSSKELWLIQSLAPASIVDYRPDRVSHN